ncbi:hypothetical protein B9Z19DRAFT_1072041 [Tuber borchii]|uniref:Uncharacterized protein n=1 Tax=Tuber borchii TaxID=42251 RepID=A0A2T7A746_TUBBO|nr:hypothetical protein B9Z19DRAFT_1072041 [Tuber borchii]
MVKFRAMVTQSETREDNNPREDNTTDIETQAGSLSPAPTSSLFFLALLSPPTSPPASPSAPSPPAPAPPLANNPPTPPADGQLPYLCLPRPISNPTCAPKTPRSNLPPQITNSKLVTPKTSSPSSPYSSYPLLTASGAPTTPKFSKALWADSRYHCDKHATIS